MENDNAMESRSHHGRRRCLAVRAAAVVLFLSLAAVPAAGHGHGGNDTGVHKNYLVIVKTPYAYDTSLYKNVSSWHASLLSSVCDMAKAALEADSASVSRLIYSYRNVVNGFAARLTQEEVGEMSRKDWFVRAVPEQTYHLMTTHTPEMLGLTAGAAAAAVSGRAAAAGAVWESGNMGEGVIIGVLDDGIYAGHPSLDGAGMKPPPARWNGRCDFNNTVCNNKLIGARSFYESAMWKFKGLDDPVLPINEGQHGTHTASTAAGAFVPNASVYGYGLGTAAGMAPRAHIAFYQVCYGDKGCDRDDILAAVDDAIEDGVDILSLSIGGDEAMDFSDDPISLGAYTAMINGVFVSAAGGNGGPSPGTVVNEPPWLLTVGASTTDRRFVTTVKLGSGVEVDGESLSQPKEGFGTELRPLVRDVGDGMCTSESVLRAQNVTGKIVICDAGGDLSTEKAKLVLRAGAVGMIVVAPQVFGSVVVPRPHVLPTAQVPYTAGQKIKAYIQATASPTASFIFKGTMFNTPQSPMVAPFSGRGPNRRSRGILKPDLIAPGVNIIAGVPKIEDVEQSTGVVGEVVVPRFDIKSGTSMAAPHLGGIAALIKNAHPTWSPAAIKSALMTTTGTTDNLRKQIVASDGTPASYFAVGAGHVNPPRALNPGLVYNLTAQDYVPYLCGLNYTDQKVSSIIHPEPPVECAKLPNIQQKDLNYPSITVILDQPPFAVTVPRAVTNVGVPASTYAVQVDAPPSVTVEVMPPTLTFKALEEVLNYTVTIKSATGGAPANAIEGELKWVCGKFVVRSPILVLPGTGIRKSTTTTPPQPAH